MIKVKKINNKATFQKASLQDVGYDLTAVGIEYKEDGRIVLDLGIQVEAPEGYYFEVVPRSSFSKSGFVLANSVGVIDPDYRGNWMMMIRYIPIRDYKRCGSSDSFGVIAESYTKDQLSKEEITELFLNKRVAQAILRKFNQHQEIEFVEELSSTERGAGGFGSTGT